MNKKTDVLKEEKTVDKVFKALEIDPIGLSAAQLANNCRLSLKTVKNCLAILVQENHVYLDSIGTYQIQVGESVKTDCAEPGEPIVDLPVPPPKAQVIQAEGIDFTKSGSLLDIIPVLAEPQCAVSEPLDDPAVQPMTIKAQVLSFIAQHPDGVGIEKIVSDLGYSAKQIRNVGYSLVKKGCVTADVIEGLHFYRFVPVDRRQPQVEQTKPLSTFAHLIDRQVVETQTVKLTEAQLEDVLKQVFGLDHVQFLTLLPEHYVVELSSQRVIEGHGIS